MQSVIAKKTPPNRSGMNRPPQSPFRAVTANVPRVPPKTTPVTPPVAPLPPQQPVPTTQQTPQVTKQASSDPSTAIPPVVQTTVTNCTWRVRKKYYMPVYLYILIQLSVTRCFVLVADRTKLCRHLMEHEHLANVTLVTLLVCCIISIATWYLHHCRDNKSSQRIVFWMNILTCSFILAFVDSYIPEAKTMTTVDGTIIVLIVLCLYSLMPCIGYYTLGGVVLILAIFCAAMFQLVYRPYADFFHHLERGKIWDSLRHMPTDMLNQCIIVGGVFFYAISFLCKLYSLSRSVQVHHALFSACTLYVELMLLFFMGAAVRPRMFDTSNLIGK